MKLIHSRKAQRAFFGLSLLLSALAHAPEASAQRVAVKTNVLDWATMSANFTAEARLSRRLSLQLGIAGNPTHINVANIQTTNFRIEPELRYWFNRPMARHFVALSATAATYNLRFKDRHFNGDAVAAGFSYGYALVLSDHWNMEFEAGVGLASISAKDYRGDKAPASKNYNHFKPVPIRLGLTFAYIFK
ncbi:MAG: DUF3575 domain-containing protein [Muribaculaceae bacterium]|nr:DUF3575 domain-containing protein [Muribaculaceae bacterium]